MPTWHAGASLGPYEIVALLGEGGMGEVYRARDTRLGRDVALKVLPGHLAHDPTALARFDREARAIARLSHPNILAIHDVGEQAGTAYVVMELLEGRTLREQLTGGALPASRSLGYAVQLADGLAAAHEKGLVHRDLKPGNIFITSDERLKILDFGLAKPVAALAAPGHDAQTVSLLTDAGVIVGTIAYASPEQLKALDVDHRSDIFSFGVVLWEMLAGRRAFERPTAAETLAAILHEDPADVPSSARDMPSGLVQIARHCLEKDPRRRFQSASDLAFALRSLASASEAAHTGARPATGVIRSVIPLPEGTWLSGLAAPALAISRDGTKVAYVGLTADGIARVYVCHLDRGETQQIPDSEHAKGPCFSSDGRWVAFATEVSTVSTRSGALRKHSFASGLTQVVCALPGFEGAWWGADDFIYFVGHVIKGLWRVESAGGQPELVVERFRIAGTTAGRCIGWPRLSHDGRSAFVIDWDASSLGDTSLLDLASGDLRSLVPSGSAGTEVSSGHLLYTKADGMMFAAAVDRRSGRVAGPATAVVRDVALDGAGGVFAVSETGTLVYARGQLRGSPFELKRLVRVDPSGRADPLGLPPAPLHSPPQLSRNGRDLVVASRTHGLWTYDLERGTRARLPGGRTRLQRFPVWSPDGHAIYFRGATLGEMGWRVFVQRSDGSADPELLIGDDPVEKRPCGITPDGETLFCEVLGGDADRGLWACSLRERGSRQRLFAGTIQDVDVSPDGRWMAYQSDEFGSTEVFVRRTAERGRSLQISTAGGRNPRWSPDGREVSFFVANQLMAVPIDEAGPEAAVGPARAVLDCANIEGFAVGPDGAIVGVERQPDAALVRQLQLVTGWLSELETLAPK